MFLKQESAKKLIDDSKDSIITELKLQCSLLKNYINEISKKLDNNMFECKPVVDLNILQPFSIERIKNKDGLDQTVYGYFIPNKDDNAQAYIPKEWHVICSNETHKKLVEQFKQYLDSKNSTA